MRRLPFNKVLKTALTKSLERLGTELTAPIRNIVLRTGNIAVFEAIPVRNFKGVPKRGQDFLNGHFNFAGQDLDVGRQGDPWPLPAPSEKFAFWLHSFDWLWDITILGQKDAGQKARNLVDQWISIYGDWNAYSWENDILANRLYAWFCNWSSSLSQDRMDAAGLARRQCTMRQVKKLRKTYNQTPEGIPKLKAAIVIALAGLFHPEKAYDYLNRGLDLLDEQIHDQILPDGGHVSRSPEQCVEALELLTTLDQALEQRGVEGSPSINRALERLRHVVPFFQMPDKGLTGFNGGGTGDIKFVDQLLRFSKTSASPFTYCPHTGYQRIHQNGTVILVDTGETSPFPYDQDAHLAPLAMEIATPTGRLIVNCGWNDQQPDSWREAMRLTAAHSTLSLNNMSAGRLVKTGLKAKLFPAHVEEGVNKVDVSRREQSEGIWLEMSHDGFVQETGLVHRRRLYVNDKGHDIRGEDSLLVPVGSPPQSRTAIGFDIRFHLHPSVKATLAQDLHSALLIQPGQIAWRFRTDGGPMRIEESVYLAEGDRPIKSEQIVISGSAFADGDGESKSNRVRWSIRRLEARS